MKQLASVVFQLTINLQGDFDNGLIFRIKLLVSLVPYLPRKAIVREAEVRKYTSTYYIEGQFHFALKLPLHASYNNSECCLAQFFLWAPANTFFLKFSIKLYYCQKGEISDLFLGKTTYVIKKVIKNYIQHIIMVTFIFHIFVEL